MYKVLWILEFTQNSFEKYLSYPMRIGSVGAKLFQVDRQMDLMKLVVALHNFVNAAESRSKI
jgi:hypothetical protein